MADPREECVEALNGNLLFRTLFDVFSNIRDDEAEHVKTMKACQDYSIVDEMTQRREEKRPKPAGSPEAEKSA